MKKRNNQGFTLIEMLMVVAVIAVLVSIVVPKISNSSDRAAAAADAANLRAAQSAIATMILEGNQKDSYSAEELGIPENPNYKHENYDAEEDVFIGSVNGDEISVSYGDFTIAMFSDIADNGTLDNSNGTNPNATEP